MADAGNQQEFPTVIGPDASFKGELSFEKGLRLMGKFEGKINTPGRLHVPPATINVPGSREFPFTLDLRRS